MTRKIRVREQILTHPAQDTIAMGVPFSQPMRLEAAVKEPLLKSFSRLTRPEPVAPRVWEISRFPLRISSELLIGTLTRPATEDWGAKKRPQPPLGKLRPIILARTYSHTECYRTTIGGWGLNERVRNGNGCFPPPIFTRVTLTFSRVTGGRLHVLLVMVRV